MIRASSVTFSGVARFFGTASSCRALGVVAPSSYSAKKNEATLAASQDASQDKASAPHIKTKITQKKKTGPAASQGTPPTSGPASQKRKRQTGKHAPPNDASQHALTTTEEHDDEVFLVLGKTLVQYSMTGDYTKLGMFQEACRSQQKNWEKALQCQDLKTLVSMLHAIVWIVSEQSGELFLARKFDGYIRLTFVRKLLLACLKMGRVSPVWSDVSVQYLQQLGPDKNEHLSDFPDWWSVAEVSSFLFGREDLGMFAGMFTCLWGAIAEPEVRQKLLSTVAEPRFAAVVDSLWECRGHAPTPHTAAKVASAAACAAHAL